MKRRQLRALATFVPGRVYMKAHISRVEKIKNKITYLNLNRILRLLYSVEPRLTLFTLAFLLLECILWISTMLVTKDTINTIGSSNSNRQLITNTLVYAILVSCLYVVVKFISSYITEYQAARINEHIDDRIHEKSVSLNLSFYESPAYFDILKRAREAGPDKPAAIIVDIVELLKNGVMLLSITALLFKIHVALLPLLLLFAIPTVLVRINVSKKLHILRIKQTPAERKASYYSYLISSDTTAKEIRVFGLGPYFRNKYLGIRKLLLKEKMSVRRRNILAELSSSIFAIGGAFSCVAAIAISGLEDKSSAGSITIFLVVFMQAFSVVHSITNGIGKIYQNNIIVRSIFELFDVQNENPEPYAASLAKPDSGLLLQVSKLNFAYPGSKKSALKDINLELQKGQIIALVGANGSGKSTLIKLLCRLYYPSSGAIFNEGKNINILEENKFRTLVSPVFQDFVKYNVSVAENIQFGDMRSELNGKKIVEAAQASGVADVVESLPEKYDTLMGKIFEEGHEISIGQWQKLAIARVLYSESKIVILDEATSALDAHAEQELFHNFKQNIGHRAAIIISHRLSTIRQADKIYVLSDGRIQASGNHEELLAISPDYQLLFSKAG